MPPEDQESEERDRQLSKVTKERDDLRLRVEALEREVASLRLRISRASKALTEDAGVEVKMELAHIEINGDFEKIDPRFRFSTNALNVVGSTVYGNGDNTQPLYLGDILVLSERGFIGRKNSGLKTLNEVIAILSQHGLRMGSLGVEQWRANRPK